MIYVLEDDARQANALWTTYAERCIQWRITMLERIHLEPPPPTLQEHRVRELEEQIRRPYISNEKTEEHWTDALLLWQRQPSSPRNVILRSVGAKLSTVPKMLGLVDTPRRFVFLPKTANILANAVGDVAQDADIIWRFRAEHLGAEAPPTLEVFPWRVAAFSLAALLNRIEHLGDGRRMDRTWYPYRISPEPDIPDLELVPSL